MKSFPLVISFIYLTLFVQCNVYQYATVESDLKKNDGGSIIVENDTLQIAYNFSENNGSVIIGIQNKLRTPLYVDWQKSPLVIGNKVSNQPVDTGIFNETVSLIPPLSSREFFIVHLTKDFFRIRRKQAKKIAIQSDSSKFPYKLDVIQYTNRESPLRFRSNLLISTRKDFESSFNFVNHFWISEIIQSTRDLRGTSVYQGRRDQFYMTKTKGIVATAGGMCALALVIRFAGE